MFALLTLIGSAGSGKLLSLVSEYFQNKAQSESEEKEREFQKDLAFKGELKAYIESAHAPIDGKTTLLSYTLCALYVMFGFTACSACLWCFWMGAGEVLIKDPDQKRSFFESIFGARNVTSLSPIGVGYLILHPILFILSMVSTGSRTPRRGR
tara:strand:+ start:590 stop:1048 length:459 start_codon:yes stop_codon:yes gene_type:complete